MSDKCNWVQHDIDSDGWSADCNNDFTLNDGTPEDNSMKFCCFCGKPLHQVIYEDEE